MENLDYLVNRDTGEIIEPDQYWAAHETLTAEDLPRLARDIATLQRQAAMVTAYRDRELTRIADACGCKVAEIESRINRLLGYAEGLARPAMEALGRKSLEYPGLGTFKVVTGRTVVDDTVYLAMKESAQAELQIMYPSLFRVVTRVAPDKKAIKAALENGAEMGGFALVRHDDRFDFKAE